MVWIILLCFTSYFVLGLIVHNKITVNVLKEPASHHPSEQVLEGLVSDVGALLCWPKYFFWWAFGKLFPVQVLYLEDKFRWRKFRGLTYSTSIVSIGSLLLYLYWEIQVYFWFVWLTTGVFTFMAAFSGMKKQTEEINAFSEKRYFDGSLGEFAAFITGSAFFGPLVIIPIYIGIDLADDSCK